MERIELLSPAGDYNCFLAAINAGADAVYLSGEKYGARAYAKNFSKEELLNAIDYAHVFNKKVFLTVNTLLKDDEMNELYEYLLPYYEAGLDGVIVQDLGVISYIRRVFSDMPVHASTQMAITGIEGIRLLEDLGVVRTVLARELSLDEIKYIHANSNMEIETFVHGALCYSYSGKCLFSSLVGGRSGNRGRCAGSCRQPYDNKFLLSTKDICCLPVLPDLIDAGIVSLKIEGRMKSPEYVAFVTAIYRKYIDLYYDNIDKLNPKEIKAKFFTGERFTKDLDILTRLYTRGGNSLGYYYKHNGKDMLSLQDASYKMDKEATHENSLPNNKKIKLTAYVSVVANTNLSILINNEFYYAGNAVSIANNKPIDIETVKKQINKTNDTEFSFEDIEVELSDNAFVRISDLNELRRMALKEYKESLLCSYRRVANSKICTDINKSSSISKQSDEIELRCEVTNEKQLKAVASISDISSVYVPFELIKRKGKEILSCIQDKQVYIKFQSVIRYNYLENNKSLILDLKDDINGVLADSHEVIKFFKDNKINVPIIGDIHLYALNNEAAARYSEIGVDNLTVPIELSRKELYKRNIKGEELIVYGYLPMMISAQCVNNTLYSCDKKYKEIAFKDRRGAKFIAINNCASCSNTILNNVPFVLQGEEEFIDKIKPSSLRLNFTVEDEKEIKSICDYFGFYIKNNHMPDYSLFENNCFTKGHLNRGVL